jgi:beta-1,4-mannosyltransferase
LIIDWHNLGFSMFDVSPRHPIRRFAQTYEIFMAQRANIHFCVTQGMKQWLMDHAKIEKKNPILVLYDRPPDFFQPTSITDKHVLWTKFNPHFWETCPNLMKLYDIQSDDESLLTVHKNCAKKENSIVVREDRPAILVSSTSWTPDEDFGILLDALCQLDAKVDHDVQNISLFQHLLVIVTGKGPLKSMYLKKIEKLALKHVTIQTMWLEAADYPRLLGCADLGVSLHTSTSGIDLPMKVVDMFGCQVPVCAMAFSCIHELVKDTVNGRIFTTSEELCKQLYELIFTVQGQDLLKEYRGNISNMKRWRENWNDTVGAEILDMRRQDKVKVS